MIWIEARVLAAGKLLGVGLVTLAVAFVLVTATPARAEDKILGALTSIEVAKDGTNGWTYDAALAAIAFIAVGDVDAATALLARFPWSAAAPSPAAPPPRCSSPVARSRPNRGRP